MMNISKPLIRFDDKGLAHSVEYGDIYHSNSGAMAQSDHVFIKGCEVLSRWQEKDFIILETGFGLGTNFLNTLTHWQKSQSNYELHFISIEKHPLTSTQIHQAQQIHPELQRALERLLEQYPMPIAGIHEMHWPDMKLRLTLVYGDILESLDAIHGLQIQVDAIYLDGFSPTKNPSMWSLDVFKKIRPLCKPATRLATWTVSSTVREHLAQAGFKTVKSVGFSTKKEMLTASISS